MDYSKFLYTATDTAKLVQLASGRPYPLSMLNYHIREGVVVPRQGYKNKPNYYELYQVIWLYILRFLKEYGIPAARIQDVMNHKFLRILKDYCSGKLVPTPNHYIICSETFIVLDEFSNFNPANIETEFFWCLPLVYFKNDITEAIAHMRETDQLKMVPK